MFTYRRSKQIAFKGNNSKVCQRVLSSVSCKFTMCSPELILQSLHSSERFKGLSWWCFFVCLLRLLIVYFFIPSFFLNLLFVCLHLFICVFFFADSLARFLWMILSCAWPLRKRKSKKIVWKNKEQKSRSFLIDFRQNGIFSKKSNQLEIKKLTTIIVSYFLQLRKFRLYKVNVPWHVQCILVFQSPKTQF